MATRSVISKIDKKVSNGEITAVYCHSDGYLSWNGKILNEHYTNGNKVDELLSNGGISILNENIGKPGIDFNDYKKFGSLKQSRFYHRDRGEELKIQTWNDGLNSFVEEAKSSYDAEFIYMFEEVENGEGIWYVYDIYAKKEEDRNWVKLNDALNG
jgi:hypothetical protein